MKAVAVFALLLGFLAISDAMTCKEAPLLRQVKRIDAGQGQVVATDRWNRAYFLSGRIWYRLGTVALSQVSVGPAGIWGVSNVGFVFKLVAGNFLRASVTRMRQVNAGGRGQVSGVSRSLAATCLSSSAASAFSGRGNLGWKTVGGGILDYSCGPYGCWAINRQYRILFTRSPNPINCHGTRWTVISGSLKSISVGSDNSLYGVNRGGAVFQRIGITARRPQGTRWVHIRTCMSVNQLTYDLRTLWLQTTSNLLLRCTI